MPGRTRSSPAAGSNSLRRSDCERIVRLAASRGLIDGGRWLDDDAATEGWALPAAGPRSPSGTTGLALAAGAGIEPQPGAVAEPTDSVALRRWRAVTATVQTPALALVA